MGFFRLTRLPRSTLSLTSPSSRRTLTTPSSRLPKLLSSTPAGLSTKRWASSSNDQNTVSIIYARKDSYYHTLGVIQHELTMLTNLGFTCHV
jgi:hypothetical protein